MNNEVQLVLINTEAQMYVKPHVARYLRIIEELRYYQETGIWPPRDKAKVDAGEMGEELVRMLENR